MTAPVEVEHARQHIFPVVRFEEPDTATIDADYRRI
jgi:hypothetical protein